MAFSKIFFINHLGNDFLRDGDIGRYMIKHNSVRRSSIELVFAYYFSHHHRFLSQTEFVNKMSSQKYLKAYACYELMTVFSLMDDLESILHH